MEGSESSPTWWQRALTCGSGQAIRWLAALGLVLWRWADDAPADWEAWIPVAAIVVFLLIWDLGSISVGGVRLELRRTKEKVDGLATQMASLSESVASSRAAAIGAISINLDSPDAAAAFAARLLVHQSVAEAERSGLAPRASAADA